MNLPQELKYTRDHEWIKVEGNQAIIGITDFAQKELGDIVYVEIETEGEDLDQGDVFGTVEAVKTVHPYETMAYDVYPLTARDDQTGLGRVGKLLSPMSLDTFAARLKAKLNLTTVKILLLAPLNSEPPRM